MILLKPLKITITRPQRDNPMEDTYDLQINSSLFDTDLDEVGWEPEVVDDSDVQSQIEFEY